MSHFFPSSGRNQSNNHKSTVQTNNELTNNGYIGKELANSDQINVLSAMQAGTKLLKLCSRRTRAHWRKFQLDPSNTKIRWVSDKKDVNDTTIYIGHIIEIICHSLEIVKKFKDTLPEELVDNYESLQQQQFTIRYMEHNKNLANYLPQLSPNQSLSNIAPNIHPNHNHPNNNNNNSSSFVRSLRNNINNKQMTLVQPYHMADESITESSSHNNTNTNNNGNGTSFWKNLLNKNKKNTKNTKNIKNNKHKQMEHSKEYVQYDEERNDSDNNNNNNIQNIQNIQNNNNFKHYHVSELHLMAEKSKIATIWIYGLERLMELNSIGVDLSLIPRSQFKISSKELMNYSMNKGYNYHKSSEELSSFKLHLDEINDGLYHIIQQMPSSQRETLMEQEENKMNENNIINNYLIKKVRQDQNDLDYILHQVSKARFDVNNIKRWSYILTRIEINIGAYQIALNNQKYVNNDVLDVSKHERKISQSSSTNYHVKSPFLQQQYSNSKYQRNAILKNRSPRSPNYNNFNNNNIVQSPKYDSV